MESIRVHSDTHEVWVIIGVLNRFNSYPTRISIWVWSMPLKHIIPNYLKQLTQLFQQNTTIYLWKLYDAMFTGVWRFNFIEPANHIVGSWSALSASWLWAKKEFQASKRKDTWSHELCQSTGEPWLRAVSNLPVSVPTTCQLEESAAWSLIQTHSTMPRVHKLKRVRSTHDLAIVEW